MAHIVKVLQPEEVRSFTAEVDNLMMNTAETIFGITLDDLRRKQVTLPVRLGGLGITSAHTLAPVACLVVACAFNEYGKQAVDLPDTWDTEEFFPRDTLVEVCASLPATAVLPKVWLAEGRLPEEVQKEWLTQKWWMNQVHVHSRDELLADVSGRDLVRLQCLSQQSSGAWLQALPSKSLGLEISPAVFRVLLRFWFGLLVLEENESSKGAATCAF